MLCRHVQRVEAVPLVLDFRAFDDGEAHAREDGFHAVANDGERMAMAERGAAAGQRDVESVGGAPGPLRRGTLFGETRFDLDLERVRQPAERRAVFRRGGRDRLHQRGDDTALACEIAVAGGLQIPIGGGPRKLRLKFVPQPGDRVGCRSEVGHRDGT